MKVAQQLVVTVCAVIGMNRKIQPQNSAGVW